VKDEGRRQRGDAEKQNVIEIEKLVINIIIPFISMFLKQENHVIKETSRVGEQEE